MSDSNSPKDHANNDQPKALSKNAETALKEARARREKIDAVNKEHEKEEGGRGGLDPARYGDWEVKGLTSDF